MLFISLCFKPHCIWDYHCKHWQSLLFIIPIWKPDHCFSVLLQHRKLNDQDIPRRSERVILPSLSWCLVLSSNSELSKPKNIIKYLHLITFQSILHRFARHTKTFPFQYIQYIIYMYTLYVCRRKFRSLTSDNMDSWKSRAEQQSQKMKKQRREAESEERRYNCAKVSRKKIHRREMLGKSRNAVFFNDLWVGWVEK